MGIPMSQISEFFAEQHRLFDAHYEKLWEQTHLLKDEEGIQVERKIIAEHKFFADFLEVHAKLYVWGHSDYTVRRQCDRAFKETLKLLGTMPDLTDRLADWTLEDLI